MSLTDFPPHAIPGSLASGATGVAFFLYEAARLSGEHTLLDPARRWCEAAREWAGCATSADWKGLPHGFLVGETGLAYMEALLCASSDDRPGVLTAVERIERVSKRTGVLRAGVHANDLIGGRGGLLCGIENLDARLPPASSYDAAREVLRRVRQRAASELEETARKGSPNEPLGIAHGVAGDVWALISIRGTGNDVVRARLETLSALQQVDEDGLAYWLPSRSSADLSLLGTWCNGIVGHTLLWCEVARRTGSEGSAELARLAAKTCSLMGGQNATLCCGLAGQALALQKYADLSGDLRFSRRAYERLVRAAQVVESPVAESPLGLWKGALGVALAALLRLHGERSFPCLEPLGRRSGASGDRRH